MKYPFILFYRDDSDSVIDHFFTENNSFLSCTIHIINNLEKLNKIYNSNYQLLIVYQSIDIKIVSPVLTENILIRTLFLQQITNVSAFNELVNQKFILNCCLPRAITRPIFSVFTSSFNSYEKIVRAFKSLQQQTLTDWEWVIIDDSPDDKHFTFLRKIAKQDNRIRIYRRSENNGCIGNVKNESVSLCRGRYVLELDHDDEVLPTVLAESAAYFDKNEEVGFIYMDFINMYENGNSFCYGDSICKGYGSYYCQKYNDSWQYVYNTPNINNITLSHLVCCPNHPRIWRRETLLKLGNYCEYLPICDDYEILLRTALNTKIAKFPKIGYIQYMNESNNNFSLIRNAEINRIGPEYISKIYYDLFKIHAQMKLVDAYEDEQYLDTSGSCISIWKRDPKTYVHKYCNLIVNNDYKRQYCIIGLNGLIQHLDEINELYKDESNDFFVLENKCSIEYLCKKLDSYGFSRMKCYSLIDVSDEQLVNYFNVTYCSKKDKSNIFRNPINCLPYNSRFSQRHEVINSLTKPKDKYLEIGVEYGYTYSNTHFLLKTGVDPDPKCSFPNIEKCLSDEFFLLINEKGKKREKENDLGKYDVIFIDGMHHSENVLRDFNNSVNVLSKGGFLFLDDILPLNYNEQLKIPRLHHYENGILKYGEEWTGDVWKFVYHLLRKYLGNINFGYFYNINYRGVLFINIKEYFQIPETDIEIEEITNYDYFVHFNSYIELLSSI
jgi:glycosyltransferase involved in cell wall biosynthesis